MRRTPEQAAILALLDRLEAVEARCRALEDRVLFLTARVQTAPLRAEAPMRGVGVGGVAGGARRGRVLQ